MLLTHTERLRHLLQRRHGLRLHAALTAGLSLVLMSLLSYLMVWCPKPRR